MACCALQEAGGDNVAVAIQRFTERAVVVDRVIADDETRTEFGRSMPMIVVRKVLGRCHQNPRVHALANELTLAMDMLSSTEPLL